MSRGDDRVQPSRVDRTASLRFVRSTAAVAYIEYVLFLAIVVAVVMSAMLVIEMTSRDVLRSASAAMFSNSSGTAPAAAEAAQHPAAPRLAAAPPRGSLWKLAALVLLVLAANAAWYALYRRRASAATAREGDNQQNEDVPELNRDLVFAKRQQIFHIIAGDMSALLESRLEVRHVMSRRTRFVSPEAPAAEVLRTMTDHQLRHVLVCKDNKLIGIISDRDAHRTGCKTAAEMMTPDPVTVAPDTLINPAVTLLIKRRISCLPVVDGDRVCGILTTTDLMMTLQCALQLLKKLAAEVSADELCLPSASAGCQHASPADELAGAGRP